MKDLILIFLGGGLGSLARYLCSQGVRLLVPLAFPLGTFVVNVAGCLLVGLLYGLADRHRIAPAVLLFLATGFCGGFTTFSTFSYEMLSLLRGGQTGLFLLYALASIAVGLAAAAFGYKLVG
jgi:CrcB protein